MRPQHMPEPRRHTVLMPMTVIVAALVCVAARPETRVSHRVSMPAEFSCSIPGKPSLAHLQSGCRYLATRRAISWSPS
jgi:hypothetical protein